MANNERNTLTSTPLATTTYAEAYARLAAIAARLKGPANATSVDTLAHDVREARAAFATCQARLAAIRAEIEAEEIGTVEAP